MSLRLNILGHVGLVEVMFGGQQTLFGFYHSNKVLKNTDIKCRIDSFNYLLFTVSIHFQCWDFFCDLFKGLATLNQP